MRSMKLTFRSAHPKAGAKPIWTVRRCFPPRQRQSCRSHLGMVEIAPREDRSIWPTGPGSDAVNKDSLRASKTPVRHVQLGEEWFMATINKLMVGESLVGEGNEVAHIDLIMGPRGSAAETAFANALTNNKDGFTSLLAVVAPNLPVKPNTILFNKVTIKDAKQAVQMFGPAQHAGNAGVA